MKRVLHFKMYPCRLPERRWFSEAPEVCIWCHYVGSDMVWLFFNLLASFLSCYDQESKSKSVVQSIASIAPYAQSLLLFCGVASGGSYFLSHINALETELKEFRLLTDEKISKAKIEAVKESTDNFLKFNHSEEYIIIS